MQKQTVWWWFINKKRELSFSFSALFFLLTFNLSSEFIFAQKENNIWCFGDSAGINFNDPFNPLPISTSLVAKGSCVTIADSTGSLLFYSNTRAGNPGHTTRVYNYLNQIVDNGDSIAGRGWYNELIILPKPDVANQFYLFSIESTSIFGLYYSLIDMNENGGLGKVIQKNVQIHNYQGWDGITAIKHANGRDWWLITKDNRNGSPNGDNFFTKYLITSNGISETRQAIGNNVYGNGGTMVFSYSGTKLLFSTRAGLIEILDFDRCTGQFSNPLIISGVRGGGTAVTFSSAFSPNENVIYVCQNDTTSYLFQYDLTASNIAASKDTIIEITSPFYYGGMLRLAPDDKIYWSGLWNNGVNYTYPYADTMYHTENMNLSVINDPNVLGSGCNLAMYSFFLNGKRTYWGLPNNPNYSLGPVIGSVCDTLTAVSTLKNNDHLFSIYPNPGSDQFYINFKNESSKFAELRIYDLYGRLVDQLKIEQTNQSLNLSLLPTGIYLLKLSTEEVYSEIKLVKL